MGIKDSGQEGSDSAKFSRWSNYHADLRTGIKGTSFYLLFISMYKIAHKIKLNEAKV
jgi:hypothetical protein